MNLNDRMAIVVADALSIYENRLIESINNSKVIVLFTALEYI